MTLSQGKFDIRCIVQAVHRLGDALRLTSSGVDLLRAPAARLTCFQSKAPSERKRDDIFDSLDHRLPFEYGARSG
jgi:hypothetical protein